MTATINGTVKPGDITAHIGGLLAEHGELTSEEIITAVIEELGIEARQVERAITRLDRQGHITRANTTAGWQLTPSGNDARQQILAKNTAPLRVPYASFVEVTARYRLITPSLGWKTGPGGEGRSVWPRQADGTIVLPGGYVRAALQKAIGRFNAVLFDLAGQPRAIPHAAWDHVLIYPLYLPADTPVEPEVVRRPQNVRGMAVGEVIHEALAPGVALDVRAVFPLTHFPPPILRQMFLAAGAVGISPSGSGKGGIWGIAELEALTVAGEDLLGAAAAREAEAGAS